MKNSKKTLYIHIGPHKTATTFLQNEIFPNLGKYFYIGRRNNKNHQDNNFKLYKNFLILWLMKILMKKKVL